MDHTDKQLNIDTLKQYMNEKDAVEFLAEFESFQKGEIDTLRYIFFGTGANGKTTLIRILQKLFSEPLYKIDHFGRINPSNELAQYLSDKKDWKMLSETAIGINKKNNLLCVSFASETDIDEFFGSDNGVFIFESNYELKHKDAITIHFTNKFV